MYRTHSLTDRAQIQAFLESDRLYAAYALGDLEPGLFEDSRWAGAESGGELQALVLLFEGLDPPALFLMGEAGGLRAILEKMPWPQRVYLTCRPQHLALSRKHFCWEETIPMWRMVLRPADFSPIGSSCVRLAPRHLEALQELYALGGGAAFTLTQLEMGIFRGLFHEEKLVAAAGTHIVSRTYDIAAVGNLFTRPASRGRGYGTQVTTAVLEDLLKIGISDIVLNVAQDNLGAIAIYERLGFDFYCPFFEGPASAL
jgi:RimJ/RimL family protein N-acetyltransferase